MKNTTSIFLFIFWTPLLFPLDETVFVDNFESYNPGAFQKPGNYPYHFGKPGGKSSGFWKVSQEGGFGVFGTETIEVSGTKKFLKIDRTSNNVFGTVERNQLSARFDEIVNRIVTVEFDFLVKKRGDSMNFAIKHGSTHLALLDLNGAKEGCKINEMRYFIQYTPLKAACTGVTVSPKIWHRLKIVYDPEGEDTYSIWLDKKVVVEKAAALNTTINAVDRIRFEDWSKGEDSNFFYIDNLVITAAEAKNIAGKSDTITTESTLIKFREELKEKKQEIASLKEELEDKESSLQSALKKEKELANVVKGFEEKFFFDMVSRDNAIVIVNHLQDLKIIREPLYKKARASMTKRNYKSAVVFLNKLINKYPKSRIGYGELARAQYKMGKLKLAKQVFRQYLYYLKKGMTP